MRAYFRPTSKITRHSALRVEKHSDDNKHNLYGSECRFSPTVEEQQSHAMEEAQNPTHLLKSEEEGDEDVGEEVVEKAVTEMGMERPDVRVGKCTKRGMRSNPAPG